MRVRLAPAPVLLLAFALSLLSLVPALQGHLHGAPPEKVFTGFPLMANDHYQYASFIRQARDGRFFMENLFTTEPQSGVYVMLYYWLLGIAGALTGLSVPATWMIFQFVGAFLYVIVFWRFSGLFLEGGRHRMLAIVLFCFAGGLDWIIVLLRMTVIPEASILEFPHNFFWNWSTFGTVMVPNWVWPAILMVLLLRTLVVGARARLIVYLVVPPAVWLAHHHSAMVVYLTFGLVPLMPLLVSASRLEKLPWERVWSNAKAVFPVLLSFGLVILYLGWARTDPVFQANATKSLEWKIFFSPWWYPLSYGLLLPPAYFGLRKILREETIGRDVILAWLAATLILSTNPIVGGAKYQFLMFPPLVLLAARGIGHLREESPATARLLRKPVVLGALIVGLFMNAPMSLIKTNVVARNGRNTYMTAADLDAMRWLDERPPGVVLASYRSAQLIPWLAGKKVYMGHWFMTLDLGVKQRQVNAFFSPRVEARTKRKVLADSGARYVFYGSGERQQGTIDPDLPLSRIYDEGGIAIYEVRRGVR